MSLFVQLSIILFCWITALSLIQAVSTIATQDNTLNMSSERIENAKNIAYNTATTIAGISIILAVLFIPPHVQQEQRTDTNMAPAERHMT